MNLIYMAKPIYGGWVNFTAHLSLINNSNIYKIGKRSEKKKRNFGFELEYQYLTIDDIIESITRAAAIKKIIRSKSSGRILKKEKLYIIESPNLSGTWIYTKGTTRKTKDGDVFYVLVSSKMSV